MHTTEIQLTSRDLTIDPAGEPVTISGHGDDFASAALNLLLEFEALFGELDMPQEFEMRDAIRRLEAAAGEATTADIIQEEPDFTLRLVRAA